MDSLAAVFTRLFFPAPEVATHCLSNLLTSPRLVNFFSRRRFTAGLQAYFVLLLRLLAFHVPAVAAHFARLGVPLTGLTAGWIYTLFAHSMPLDRVEILWDSLLAASPSLPMLVYVSIFHQVNQQCRLLVGYSPFPLYGDYIVTFFIGSCYFTSHGLVISSLEPFLRFSQYAIAWR